MYASHSRIPRLMEIRDALPEKKQGQEQNGSAEDAHSEDAQQATPHGTVALAWDF